MYECISAYRTSKCGRTGDVPRSRRAEEIMLSSCSAPLIPPNIASSIDYATTIVAARRYGSQDYKDYYKDESGDAYDDRPPEAKGRRKAPPLATSNPFTSLLGNSKQLGSILVGAGVIFTFMGMMFFFEGNLIRLGNICLVSGIVLLIGPKGLAGFFLKESRMQATIITSIGKPTYSTVCSM